jgi:hypothetical protein
VHTHGQVLRVVKGLDERADHGDIHPGRFELLEGIRVI